MKEQIIDLLDRYWHYELLLDETTDRLMELIAESEKRGFEAGFKILGWKDKTLIDDYFKEWKEQAK